MGDQKQLSTPAGFAMYAVIVGIMIAIFLGFAWLVAGNAELNLGSAGPQYQRDAKINSFTLASPASSPVP